VLVLRCWGISEILGVLGAWRRLWRSRWLILVFNLDRGGGSSGSNGKAFDRGSESELVLRSMRNRGLLRALELCRRVMHSRWLMVAVVLR
jgi:hypothetical protein